ncbi:helix-turn-helix domain-containing protein [Xenorhabdus griffiniae]|uniref:helix-turn-helix domain-containing protein n=1 Tax=Xenorhabdus griffiniae TaxID=351672 RepID=UPI002359BFC3|nr:helix-turn-helix transcriptional regulator [Xenorhabdus griffiniae]MDC9607261.1 helix-turn-helix transcriptional regulator [Xenorhabdus griffiniae]
MNKNNSIAARIIERRAMLGLSQNALAQQSNVAPAQISRYEAEKRKPSAQVISRLASALYVPFEWLAYGDTTNFPKTDIAEKGGVELNVSIPQELHDQLKIEADRLGKKIEDIAAGYILREWHKSKN